MARYKTNRRRDQRIFRKTAKVKSTNIPGHNLPRGGQCL